MVCADSFDEIDGDDKFGEEFMCPFCGEDFDMVGLCCHMDEDHKREANNGVFNYFMDEDHKQGCQISLLSMCLIIIFLALFPLFF